MTHAAMEANQALRDAATRLVAERRDLPPGSVLRCFSKSVRTALLTGFPTSQVAAEAERLTRELLALRPGGHQRPQRPGRRVVAPRVPRPRRVS